MKVKEITVQAGRTVSHPFESYANLRSDITMRADLEDGDDADAAIKALQAEAENRVQGHIDQVVKDIQSVRELEELDRRIGMYERQMPEKIAELERMKKQREELEGPRVLPSPVIETKAEHHDYDLDDEPPF